MISEQVEHKQLMTEQIDQLSIGKDKMSENIKAMQDEAKEKEEQHFKEIDTQKQIIETLNAENNAKYKKLHELNTINENLSFELSESRSKISSLESTMESLKNDKVDSNQFY